MRHRKVLLGAAVAAILAVAAWPLVDGALEDRRIAREAARQAVLIEAKERELACLQRLEATGLPEGMDVGKEIARCRALAADPAAPGD